jgi:hypothetical protein
MTTLVKISIGLAAVSGIVALVPAIKGPFNRARNEINDKLDAEYVVDNYKAEYVKLHNAKGEVSKKLSDIKINKAVAEKKLAYAVKTYEKAKQEVIETGTSDMKKFNAARDYCESKKLEVENLTTMIDVYSNAVVKLESSLNLVECNMRKIKYNVDTLAAKKTLVDSVKSVNECVENLTGVGATDMAISVEKLNDSALRESIKLEVLADQNSATVLSTKEDAEAYINSLK